MASSDRLSAPARPPGRRATSTRRARPSDGRLGQQGGHGGDRALGGFLRVGPGPTVQEQQVDVARVVQLRAAELPEADDREARVVDERERLGEAGIGDRADLGHDLLERRAVEVAGGDPQHRAPPEAPQTRHRTETIDVDPELGSQRAPIARRHVGQRCHLVGVGHEEVGGCSREPEQPGRDLGDLRSRERLPGGRMVPHPREGDPGELGVGRAREGATEHLGRQHPGIIAPSYSSLPVSSRPISMRRISAVPAPIV